MSMSHVKSFEHKSIELKNWAGPEVNNDIDNRRKGGGSCTEGAGLKNVVGFLFLLEIKKNKYSSRPLFFYE